MPRVRATSLRSVRRGHDAAQIITGTDKWHTMAWAYMEAGDRLALRMAKTLSPWEILGTPMMFLYRHYIELQLKCLLHDAGELLDAPETIGPKHYLLSLWKRVRKLLLKISRQKEDEWFRRADLIIGEFDSIDPTSFAFRYPVGIDGRPSLDKDLYIDPKNVRRMIEELNILLDGASSQISEYMDYKNEY